MQEPDHLNVRLAWPVLRRLLAQFRINYLAPGIYEALVALLNSLLLPLRGAGFLHLVQLHVVKLLVVAQVLIGTATFLLADRHGCLMHVVRVVVRAASSSRAALVRDARLRFRLIEFVVRPDARAHSRAIILHQVRSNLLMSLLNPYDPLSLCFLVVIVDGRIRVAVDPVEVFLRRWVFAPRDDRVLAGKRLQVGLSPTFDRFNVAHLRLALLVPNVF